MYVVYYFFKVPVMSVYFTIYADKDYKYKDKDHKGSYLGWGRT